MPPPDPSADQARAAIAAALGQIGFCLPGTRLLTPAQYQAYAPWFANARRLRALATELEVLSLEEMARTEGWDKITPGTQAPARTKLVRVPRDSP